MIWDAVLSIVNNVFGSVADHFEAKREIKKAQVASAIAIEEAKVKATIDWDAQAMLNAQSSWKDEYLLILFSIPLILCFVPELGPPIVQEGFNVLKETPDWYKASIGVMVAASYGFKKLTDFYGIKNGS